jgi:hypothetical protein
MEIYRKNGRRQKQLTHWEKSKRKTKIPMVTKIGGSGLEWSSCWEHMRVGNPKERHRAVHLVSCQIF